MTRTSLLAATAVAALATSSLLVTDADARGSSGFGGHSSPPMSRPVARQVAPLANHFRPAAHTVSYPVSHPNFSQARPNFSQPHPTVAHQDFGQHLKLAQAHQDQAHIGMNALVSHNAVATNGSASTVNSHVNNAGTLNQTGNATGQTKSAIHKGTSEQQQVQNAANADQKRGNADVALANQLTGAAAVLQAKAAAEAKTNPKEALADSQRATSALAQAAKFRAQGQALLKTAQAEKAVLDKGGQATPGQIQQVQNAATADQKKGNADIATANQLTGAATVLQAKAAAEAKTNPKQALADSQQAAADLKQAATLRTQGQSLLKTAQAEKAVLKDTQKGPQNGGTNGTAATPGGSQDPGQPGASQAAVTPGGGGQAASAAPSTSTPGDNNQAAPQTQTGAQTPGTATQLALNTNKAPAVPQNGAVSFKALSLAWNQDGGWVVRVADALPAANTEAVSTCNRQFGSCQLAASVDAGAFGCLAVMSTADRQLFSATGPSIEAATTSLQQKLDMTGAKGEVQYSGCNGG